jgi:chorismate synthase
MREVIEAARLDADSVGGVVEVAAIGMPVGVGSPIFDTIEGRLAFGYYGIPAVKGVEFGAGFSVAQMRGSQNNDEFYMAGEGVVKTRTNNHGGVLGGITSGMPVTARLAFKPTPSIGKPQKSIDYRNLTDAEMGVKGRHDPCVAVRAVPVVEAVTAIVLMDMLLEEGR